MKMIFCASKLQIYIVVKRYYAIPKQNNGNSRHKTETRDVSSAFLIHQRTLKLYVVA